MLLLLRLSLWRPLRRSRHRRLGARATAWRGGRFPGCGGEGGAEQREPAAGVVHLLPVTLWRIVVGDPAARLLALGLRLDHVLMLLLHFPRGHLAVRELQP